MPVPTRLPSRPLVATLAILLASTSILTLRPGAGDAGATKRSAITQSWSGSSSSKGTRGESRRSASKSYGYTVTTSDEDPAGELDAWTFSRENGHWRNSSGSKRDRDEVERVLDREGGDLFWFRRGDERYLVTDPAAMTRLAELFAPQEELGRKQGELGRRQGELGREQGTLGRQQGQLGRMQARLALQQARLSREQATRGARDIEAASLERHIDEASRMQAEVGELQSRLGERQAALGERQSELGERQAALGQEQERVSKEIARRLEALTAEWIADGVARRLGR